MFILRNEFLPTKQAFKTKLYEEIVTSKLISNTVFLKSILKTMHIDVSITNFDC